MLKHNTNLQNANDLNEIENLTPQADAVTLLKKSQLENV
jgi:hypothetical protein